MAIVQLPIADKGTLDAAKAKVDVIDGKIGNSSDVGGGR